MINAADEISLEELEEAVRRRELDVQSAESRVREAVVRLKRAKNMLKLTQKRLKFKKAGKDSRIWLKPSERNPK